MKAPFDLQKCLDGHPLITRNGRKAKFIAYVPEASEHDRVVLLLLDCLNIIAVSEAGEVSLRESELDLFLDIPESKKVKKKVKKEGWVNVYKHSTENYYYTAERIHTTEKEAHARLSKWLKGVSVKIQWEKERNE